MRFRWWQERRDLRGPDRGEPTWIELHVIRQASGKRIRGGRARASVARVSVFGDGAGRPQVGIRAGDQAELKRVDPQALLLDQTLGQHLACVDPWRRRAPPGLEGVLVHARERQQLVGAQLVLGEGSLHAALGRALVLEMGRATLELFDEAQVEVVDQLEAGRRLSGQVCLALKVPDLERPCSACCLMALNWCIRPS